MKIKISEKILSDFDKNHFSPKYEGVFFTIEEGEKIHTPLEDDGRSIDDVFPFWVMDRYHLYYRILGYFSTFYNGKILVDIGSRRGYSAASLAFNENNTVYTYNNVEEEPENDVFNKLNNIKDFVETGKFSGTPLGNILDSGKHREIILKSDLIFCDVDPHSGEHETQLIKFLSDNNYKGITIWDDINDQLKNWFSDIEASDYKHTDKYDLKEYTWKEGTGVICFGEQEIILE
jgi:hypothetical protein